MKKRSISASMIFLVVVLTLSVGCAKKPNDAQINSEVQNKFSQDSGLSSKELGVQVNNGVVTLAGTVDNDAQREAASRQAASVGGVREVVNNLQVESSGPALATSAPPVAAAKPSADVAMKGSQSNEA